MAIIKNGHPIRSLTEWEHLAPPKRKMQWKQNRSAMELARAWLGDELPIEVTTTLATHSDFGPVTHWVAEPEAKLPFDDLDGEPRNSDLLVCAEDRFGPFIIAVEGKADESFGQTLEAAWVSAGNRKQDNPRSQGQIRITQLLTALFQSNALNEATRTLRYQLLTATAGTIAAAERRKVTRAILFIHEFVTDLTVDKKHQANSSDLEAFLSHLPPASTRHVGRQELIGPFVGVGVPIYSERTHFYVGKAQRDIRTPSSSSRLGLK